MRATKRIGLGLITVIVAFQGISSAENPTSEISPVIKRWMEAIGKKEFIACGLNKLEPSELAALENVMARALKAGAADRNLDRAARDKMRQDGWEEVQVLGWIRKDHDDWLVVSGGIGASYATKDIPFTLSEFSLPVGVYWGKTEIFGGLEEIIDSSGSDHSFMFADWVSFD